jgi:hypothetical protein
MQISVIGIAVSIALVFVVIYLRAGPLAALLGSLAFGSTAIVTIGFLGGASPLIYVVFEAGVFAAAFLNRDVFKALGHIFKSITTAWIVLAFMIYATFSALVFPRLFVGATNVFVASREQGGVFEVPLAPVSGNISQAGYLVLNCLTFFAVSLLLTRRFRLDDITRGFFLWGWLNAGMGMIDFIAKYGHLGDVLAPIRSGNFAMLTNVETSGFPRIAGAFSEASAFGGVSLTCLAFSYTYWRRRRTRQSFWLTVITFFLLLASTSTTAYAGLALLCIPVAFSIIRQFAFQSTRRADLFIIFVFLFAVTAILATSVIRPQILTPAANLIDTVILEKSKSQSGQERAYWNEKSLQSVVDTNGIGVGLGSSRASSWPIAVVSQLGIIGLVLVGLQTSMLIRGMRGLRGRLEPKADAAVASARASTLAGLVSAALAGEAADPGIVFFITLAIIAVSRVYITENINRAAASPQQMPRWPWPSAQPKSV